MLPQLANDVLIFSNESVQVKRLIKTIPYLQENMSPFIDQCALVVLSLVDIATKPFIQQHFFKRPSMLAKLLDTFDQLDACIQFE